MTGTKYLLPILALWILLRCIRSMLREKYEPETWAWLLDEDGAALPVSHWESIIGLSLIHIFSGSKPAQRAPHGL